MIAERAGLNMELAFSALRNYARDHNLRSSTSLKPLLAAPCPSELGRPTRHYDLTSAGGLPFGAPVTPAADHLACTPSPR